MKETPSFKHFEHAVDKNAQYIHLDIAKVNINIYVYTKDVKWVPEEDRFFAMKFLYFKKMSKNNFLAIGNPTVDSKGFTQLMDYNHLLNLEVKRVVDGRVYMDYDMSTLTEKERQNLPNKECSKTCIRSEQIKLVGTTIGLHPPHHFKDTEYSQIEEHTSAKEILDQLFSGKKKPEKPHDCDLYSSSKTRKDLTDSGEEKYRHVGYKPDWKSRNHYLLICEYVYKKFEKLEWVKLDFVKEFDEIYNV